MILFIIISGYFALLYMAQIVQYILLALDKKEPVRQPDTYPVISILLAVRNEEKNILPCLQHIATIDWPTDRLEILIGNDASEDQTEALVQEYIQDKRQFRLISIRENLGKARGKANVLAHLAREARGEFFCITDADIRVPQTWIRGLYSAWKPGYGTVNGVTIVRQGHWLSNFQALDWIYAFAQVRLLSNHHVPISAVGNNMLISREAYESTGGYENLPFSLTEDFELFRHTLRKGWKYKNLLQQEVLALTEGQPDLRAFLSQRKRWMTGAMQVPWFPLSLLGLHGIFFPFLVAAILLNPIIASVCWIVKILLDYSFTRLALRKVGHTEYMKYFVMHQLLGPPMLFLQVVNFYLPGGIQWKGRNYSRDGKSLGGK